MIIYIIFFVCNILFGLSLCFVGRKFYSNELNRNKIKRRIYLIVTTLQYGLLCGLRAISMGYDTFSYQIIFDMTPGSWSTLFVRTSYVEMGFSLLCSFVKILGGNYRTLLIICSLFSMGACCVFFNRHSNNVILSVFIIISFPFFYSQFDVIRHFLAVGITSSISSLFGMIFSVNFIEDNVSFESPIVMAVSGFFIGGVSGLAFGLLFGSGVEEAMYGRREGETARAAFMRDVNFNGGIFLFFFLSG